MKSGFVLVVTWFCVSGDVEFEKDSLLKEGSKCKTKLGSQGVCRSISNCPHELHTIENFPSEFWTSICGFDGIVPNVCCLDGNLRPSERACQMIEEDLRSGNLDLIDARAVRRVSSTTKKNVTLTNTEASKGKVNVTNGKVNMTNGKVNMTSGKVNMTSELLRQDVPVTSSNQTGTNMEPHQDTPQQNKLEVTEKTINRGVTNVFGIFGGFEVLNGTHRHMVALGYLNNKTYDWLCGGTLISESYVLTAAHCVASAIRDSPNVVWVGVHDLRSQSEGIIRTVENYTLHPLYTPSSRYHDIALLKVEHVRLGRQALPACLHNHLESPKELTILGWGSTEIDGGPQSPTLQTALLTKVSQPKCNESYATPKYVPANLRAGITGTMICAQGSDGLADACQGDSGGPLQIPRGASPLFTVVGVTSFGKLCSGIGVYTRVASYLDWIEAIVWPEKK